MADKPSLYVVEKKEVIILVVLFVLVTVLSFTLGVRYGESVGKKLAIEANKAEHEIGGNEAEVGGGTLGKTGEHKDEAGSLEKSEKGEKEEKSEGKKEEKAEGKEEKAESKPAKESHSPEEAAKHAAPVRGGNVDKNSDEYLLNALKDAGVEAPGGKAPKEAELPNDVKDAPAKSASRARSGSYVIQVGSHPTDNEASGQVRNLKGRHVQAEILPAFKDKQGEWHRVVLGGFKTKKDAEREAAALKAKGSISSYFIWRLP